MSVSKEHPRLCQLKNFQLDRVFPMRGRSDGFCILDQRRVTLTVDYSIDSIPSIWKYNILVKNTFLTSYYTKKEKSANITHDSVKIVTA